MTFFEFLDRNTWVVGVAMAAGFVLGLFALLIWDNKR